MRRSLPAPGVEELARPPLALLSLSACGGDRSRAPCPDERLPPGEVSYTPPGEALRKGYPVTPAPLTARFPNGLAIMTRQVSQAEYAACVRAGGCRTPDPAQRATAPDMPAAGISWSDASAYAAWLGRHRPPAAIADLCGMGLRGRPGVHR